MSHSRACQKALPYALTKSKRHGTFTSSVVNANPTSIAGAHSFFTSNSAPQSSQNRK